MRKHGMEKTPTYILVYGRDKWTGGKKRLTFPRGGPLCTLVGEGGAAKRGDLSGQARGKARKEEA